MSDFEIQINNIIYKYIADTNTDQILNTEDVLRALREMDLQIKHLRRALADFLPGQGRTLDKWQSLTDRAAQDRLRVLELENTLSDLGTVYKTANELLGPSGVGKTVDMSIKFTGDISMVVPGVLLYNLTTALKNYRKTYENT